MFQDHNLSPPNPSSGGAAPCSYQLPSWPLRPLSASQASGTPTTVRKLRRQLWSFSIGAIVAVLPVKSTLSLRVAWPSDPRPSRITPARHKLGVACFLCRLHCRAQRLHRAVARATDSWTQQPDGLQVIFCLDIDDTLQTVQDAHGVHLALGIGLN